MLRIKYLKILGYATLYLLNHMYREYVSHVECIK